MRRLTRLLLTLLVSLALVAEGLGSVGSAQVGSEPVGPKDWTGEVEISVWTSSISEFWFFQNGCDWAGQDDFNGLDLLIWDVEGYGGLPAQISWDAESGDLGSLSVSYYTADCEKIIGVGETLSDVGKTYDILLPAFAKSMALRPQAATGGMYGATIEMHSDGTPVKQPKKKKKRKRR